MSAAKSLYASRPVLNYQEIADHAKAQGFPTTIDDAMHVTQIYSKQPLVWPEPHEGEITIPASDKREVRKLGDQGAVAFTFESPQLTSRWNELIAAGAKTDFDSFLGHHTISWNVPEGFDLSKVEPWKGEIKLGAEVFKEIEKEFDPSKIVEKRVYCEVAKVAEEHGLVFGWAIVCTEKGEDHYDLHKDHIPEDVMLASTTEFMEDVRVAKEMHFGDEKGIILHSMPLTKEIAKAFGIETEKTGWMIAAKPTPEVLSKFASGEYTGFSIGGEAHFTAE